MQFGCATRVSIAFVMSSSVALSSFFTCRSVRTISVSHKASVTRHEKKTGADLERVASVGALRVIGDGLVPGKFVKDIGGRHNVALGCDLVREAEDGAGDLQG